MKAFVYKRYGSPKVLKLAEIEKPTPKGDEVLVKIRAVSVNPYDWHLMRGAPFLARLFNGLLRPKNPILGADIAGEVVAVGESVTEFKVGDAVFGGSGFGGFAEYASIPQRGLVHKPANISFEEAASFPIVAFTALQGLRDAGKVQAGQQVLINGASGGVGSMAVKLATYFGAEVTGVCSTRNLELVRSIGANHVIDYTQTDFTKTGKHYDLIFDAVGNRSVADFQRILKPNGLAVVAGFTTLWHMLRFSIGSKRVSKRGTQKIGMMPTAVRAKPDLLYIAELIESGKLTPLLDRCYPFNELPQAVEYLETGRARGKVVVTV